MAKKSAFAGAFVADSVVKDMALTQQEFFRDIGRAMTGLDYRVEGQQVLSGGPGRGITIALSDLPPRRLSALMVLPRCAVTISFQGYDEAERQAFLAAFDQAFQRGGG
jgi:hypothetical protein